MTQKERNRIRIAVYILQGIRYCIIGLIPFAIMILIMNAIEYSYATVPDYTETIFNVIAAIFMIGFIIVMGVIIDTGYLRKWR